MGIGDSWEGEVDLGSNPALPTKMKATYTLTGRHDGLLIIKIEGKISPKEGSEGINGSISGTMNLEEATGWTKSSQLKMKIKGLVQGNAMEMSADVKIKTEPKKKKNEESSESDK